MRGLDEYITGRYGEDQFGDEDAERETLIEKVTDALALYCYSDARAAIEELEAYDRRVADEQQRVLVELARELQAARDNERRWSEQPAHTATAFDDEPPY